MDNTAVNTLRNSTRPLNKYGGVLAGVFKIILIIVGVVILYYLYKYLFTNVNTSTVLLPSIVSTKDSDAPFIKKAKEFDRLMEGGEFSISTWLYVNDWTHRTNKYKHVLSIGSEGDSGWNTLVVYLGASSNTLHVRVQSTDVTQATTTVPHLTNANVKALMDSIQTGAGPMEAPAPCDVPSIELQRWILATVVLNNKTCDVYLDGKLARSCILPGFFRVPSPSVGYNLEAYKFGGFGGFMSGLTTYGYAMNPEEVWKVYMAGPTGQLSFMDWLKSFFKPSDLEKQFYPKMN
jgi:hypothetical protein